MKLRHVMLILIRSSLLIKLLVNFSEVFLLEVVHVQLFPQ